MQYPKPIYVGQFDPVKAGDVVDLYLDFTEDVPAEETLDTVTLSLEDANGAAVAGAIKAHTETDARTDFRVEVPATAGTYMVKAELEISDGQELTHYAKVRVYA